MHMLYSGKYNLSGVDLQSDDRSPPPTEAIWRKNIKYISQRDGRKYPIAVTLMGRERTVPSPVNALVKYPECMVCSFCTSTTPLHLA